MKKKSNQIIFLLIAVCVEMVIKITLNSVFPHLIGVKQTHNMILDFYPIINPNGIFLAECLGMAYTDIGHIVLLILIFSIFTLFYMKQLYLLKKHKKSQVLCVPLLLMMASLLIRIIFAGIHGYTIDYVSIFSGYVYDFADFYLILGSIGAIIVGLTLIIREEEIKKKLRLSFGESISYELVQWKAAVVEYFSS